MRDQALIESKVCQRGDRLKIKETWSEAARKAAALSRKMQPGLSEAGKLTAGPSMPSPGEHSVQEDDDGFHVHAPDGLCSTATGTGTEGLPPHSTPPAEEQGSGRHHSPT